MGKWKLGGRPAWYDKRVALILQGGGALGSYQAGVYEELARSDYLPDWVAGISIGAVNAAIIAGNAPENRVARLREFWEEITAPSLAWPLLFGGLCSRLQHQLGALSALLLGQPGFFRPHPAYAWFTGASPIAYYDASALKTTLEQLVDFGRINARETRFSVGAVNVQTGNFTYFDNAEITIRPEHVMASAALPPGFAPVEIDGELYWDGGLVSNTPLQYVLAYTRGAAGLLSRWTCFRPAGQCRALSTMRRNARRIFDTQVAHAWALTVSAPCMRSAITSIRCWNASQRLSRREQT